MNPDPKRHLLRSSELGQSQSHTTQSGSGMEFGTAEELIRHDAAQTRVPGDVERRLRASLCNEPKPGKSWWRRLFG